ncbi:uncharacterized protein LOC128669361 [Plodia interpunctella]|uniref:uncharacterized protein LOC128669361 n=1 Tax=Plodia interpunctella TaxID=58824 RepID=UPI0023677635|nr:uncharacterized protein LOC128669361 [Plodia interpunctella]
MDPVIDNEWIGFKQESVEEIRNVGNIVRSWQSRELGIVPLNSPSNKIVLENAAEDILVRKQLNIRSCDLPGYPRSTFLMVFSPDGTKVASTHGNHNVYVSELASGKHVRILKGHPRTPWCIAFHPSHPQLIGSGCLGGQVRVWDIESGGSEVWNVRSETVIASIAFHPREQLLVIATHNELYFWDWSRPAPFTKVSTNNFNEKVRYVAFDGLGHKLITGISYIPGGPQSLHVQEQQPLRPTANTTSTRRDDPDDSNDRPADNSGNSEDVMANSYQNLVQRYDSLVRNYQRLFRVRHRLVNINTPSPPNTIDRGTDPMETDTSPSRGASLWVRPRSDDHATASSSRRPDSGDSGGEGSSSRLLNLDVLSINSNPTRNQEMSSNQRQSIFGSRSSAFLPLNEAYRRTVRAGESSERSSRLLPNPFSSTNTSPRPPRVLPDGLQQFFRDLDNSSRTSIFTSSRQDSDRPTFGQDFARRRRNSSPSTSRSNPLLPEDSPSTSAQPSSNPSGSSRNTPSASGSSRPTMTNSSTQISPSTAPVDAQSINESLDLIRDILRDSGTRLLNLITNMSLSTLASVERNMPRRGSGSRPHSDDSEGGSLQRPSVRPRMRLFSSMLMRRELLGSSSDSDSDQSLEVNIFRTRNSTFREDNVGDDDLSNTNNSTPDNVPLATDRMVFELNNDARDEEVLPHELDFTVSRCRFRVRTQNNFAGEGCSTSNNYEASCSRTQSNCDFNPNRPSTSRDAGTSSSWEGPSPCTYNVSSSRVNASRNGDNVPTNRDNASTIRDSASTIRASASTSRDNASTSRASASTSRDNASTIRASASTSRDNASTIRASASTSRDNASTSRASASTSRDNASTSRASASTSRDNASTSRDSASTNRDNASTSKDSASTSRDNASTSRDSASTSRDNASTSRDSASTSRDSAQTRSSGVSSDEAFRKVKGGVKALQKHAEQLTNMWLRGNRTTMRELRTMWENLRRRVLALHRETGRQDIPSYYTRSLLERCMMLTEMSESINLGSNRNTRANQRNEDNNRSAEARDLPMNSDNPGISNQNEMNTSTENTCDSRPAQVRRSPPTRASGFRSSPSMRRRLRPNFRWRQEDELRRRYRNTTSHRIIARQRDFMRAIEISNTRHEIRMRAMQVLSVMFNMMMMCLEERGLSQLIIDMLRTLKKALALTCLMLMTNRHNGRPASNQTPPSQNVDSLNVVRIQNVDHTGPVNVDGPDDPASPHIPSDTEDSQKTNVENRATEEPKPSTSQACPAPPASSRISQRWSNRLAVQISAANRNNSATARNRRDLYLECKRLKALHRTNPTAHPLIKKRVLPPASTYRIPALRFLPSRVKGPGLITPRPRPTNTDEPVAGPSNEAPAAEGQNREYSLMNEFEHRVNLIRIAHAQAAGLRHAARNRFRRLQTIRLYTPSSVREMFALQTNNSDNQPGNRSPQNSTDRPSGLRTFAATYAPLPPGEAFDELRAAMSNFSMPVLQVNDQPSNSEAQGPQQQRFPRIHEYLQPIILAQNAMVVDVEGNLEGGGGVGGGGGGGGGSGGAGGTAAARRMSGIASLLDAGFITEPQSSPSHRVQAWDFTTGDTPDIADSTKNVVVQRCKIHNDASIDISKDGRLLVALLPVPRFRNSNHWLGVYSLEWGRLGQCLHTAVLEQSAVSVALSPTARHLAVGLGLRRITNSPRARNNVIALLYKLEPLENSSRTGLSPIKELEQNWAHSLTSLNCIRWAPQPGQGLVYANNTGQLIIMS